MISFKIEIAGRTIVRKYFVSANYEVSKEYENFSSIHTSFVTTNRKRAREFGTDKQEWKVSDHYPVDGLRGLVHG